MKDLQKNLLSVLIKYKSKLIKAGIIVVLLIVAMLAVFFKSRSAVSANYEELVKELRQEIAGLEDQIADAASVWEDQPTKQISIDLIKAEIKDIGELATIEYLYTDAGKFEDVKKKWGINIPFTSKSFITKWDGTIKAGVRIDEIVVEVNDEGKEILVKLPGAEILSHEINSESVQILDEKDGLFNKVTVENTVQFEAASKTSMEERAIENGILNKAFENAKGIIEKLINNDVVQELGYSIKFEVIE